MPDSATVSLKDIERARRALDRRIRLTPVEPSAALSALTGAPVHLKLEHQQITGSFKLRGATHAVLCLGKAQRANGVVGVSTGNHGRGLAYAARAAGVRCIICMSALVPKNKVEGIKAQGAEVRIVGRSQDDAQAEVDRLVAEAGMIMLPPFDHPDIIAGQGTLGLEILEQLPAVETVVVPVSGGGLISGMAVALKARKPGVRVIGVSMERGAAMYQCQKAGKPIFVEELATLADSLGGGIGLDNRYTFALVRDLVNDLVLVSEAEIAAAIRHAYWEERQIIEGSGAVGIAALRAGRIADPGVTVAVLSGGNIDMDLHHRIIGGEAVDVTKE
ncbi:MAG TPA: hydroxyectoine utilization dehydratase EutB [Kiloniellales bacterium]